MITHLLLICFIVGGTITALAAFDLTNDLPGYLADPDPRFHDTNMRAGEAIEQ